MDVGDGEVLELSEPNTGKPMQAVDAGEGVEEGDAVDRGRTSSSVLKG